MQLGPRKTNWSLRLHWKDAWCKLVQTEVSVSGNEMQSTLKGKGDILIRFFSSRTGFYSSWARPPTWYDRTTTTIWGPAITSRVRRTNAGRDTQALVQADRWLPERGSSRASERGKRVHGVCRITTTGKILPRVKCHYRNGSASISLAQMRGNIVHVRMTIINHMEMYICARPQLGRGVVRRSMPNASLSIVR